MGSLVDLLLKRMNVTLVVDFIVSGKLLLVLAFVTSGNADDLSLVSSGNFEVFLLPGIGSAAFGSSIRGIFGWGVLLQVINAG